MRSFTYYAITPCLQPCSPVRSLAALFALLRERCVRYGLPFAFALLRTCGGYSGWPVICASSQLSVIGVTVSGVVNLTTSENNPALGSLLTPFWGCFAVGRYVGPLLADRQA